MVYVNCTDSDVPLVAELFRLFDVSWSRTNSSKSEKVMISFGETDAIKEAIPKIQYDRHRSFTGNHIPAGKEVKRLQFSNVVVPIYCGARKIDAIGEVVATTEDGFAIAKCIKTKESISVIFGYDLLAELHFLLTIGQPVEYAAIPTLDLHIDLLKNALSYISRDHSAVKNHTPHKLLILTHDVDIPFLRPHLFDTVFAGILARGAASLTGRSKLARLRRKALLLSLGHAVGLTQDPLQGLSNCLAIEEELGVKSTFFLVSRQGTAGKPCPRYEGHSRWRSMRKVKYGRRGLERVLSQLKDTGNEVALHGVDAWISSVEAVQEKSAIEKYGFKLYGNRMHWLYWGMDTPQALADAGFTYDSSLGYNTTIGFRCGTAKPIRFPSAPTLWELPMIVMDAALIKDKNKELTPEEVVERISPIAQHISKHGGALTINWHVRSFSLERPWVEHYKQLVSFLLDSGFSAVTASEAIERFISRERQKE